MQLLERISFRQKVLIATLILVLALVTIALVSVTRFASTQAKLDSMTRQYQPEMMQSIQLTTYFYHSLSMLGNYLVEKNDERVSSYLEKMDNIDSTLDSLLLLTDDELLAEDNKRLRRIRQLVNTIKEYNQRLIELSRDVNKNQPAIGIANTILEPMANRILTDINDSLHSIGAAKRPVSFEVLSELRTNWILVVSEVRHFLAFRDDLHAEDINLYLSGVAQNLTELTNKRQQLDDEQQEILDEIRYNLKRYKTHLNQALAIHASEFWRLDKQLMQEKITPTLDALTKELELLVSSQRQRILLSNAELAEELEYARASIMWAIQGAVVVTIFFTFLTLRHHRLQLQMSKQLEEQADVRFKANHDSLTGLANRSFFIVKLRDFFASKKDPFCIFFIDLDGFKQVNDTLGHEAGDFILKESGSRLKQCTRTTDFVARLGGDEFTVILPGVGSRHIAERMADLVVKSLKQPYDYPQGKIDTISASVGVAFSNSDELDDLAEPEEKVTKILKLADRAMYRAKDGGKDRYAFY